MLQVGLLRRHLSSATRSVAWLWRLLLLTMLLWLLGLRGLLLMLLLMMLALMLLLLQLLHLLLLLLMHLLLVMLLGVEGSVLFRGLSWQLLRRNLPWDTGGRCARRIREIGLRCGCRAD